MSTTPVDGDRLWADLMTLAAITDPDRPYTRRSFSARFLEGRDWLAQKFADAGLSVRIDEGANLIGRLEGTDPAAGTIIIGSHSDTVPSGGRFDGIAGVLAGLEVARAIQASGYCPRHSLEIVDFLAEEPSEFGLSCIGSRAMVGALDDAMLAFVDPAGETLATAIDRMGGDTRALKTPRRTDIAGYLELHIEQGIVLERQKKLLGLVTGIAGIARIELSLSGSADHAGTTPMAMRRDAGVAAAELSLFAERLACDYAANRSGHFVATTGILQQHPNAANVVPGSARLVFDIRAESPATMDAFIEALRGEGEAIATRRRVEVAKFRILSRTSPAMCDHGLIDLLGRSAERLGHSTLRLASGAGHDAAFMSRIAPMAMVFVPSRDGRSHAPEEWTEPHELLAGTATLYEAVLMMDARNGTIPLHTPTGAGDPLQTHDGAR